MNPMRIILSSNLANRKLSSSHKWAMGRIFDPHGISGYMEVDKRGLTDVGLRGISGKMKKCGANLGFSHA